jgi:hypothetical protein
VQGTAVGVPTAPQANVSAALSGNNTAGAVQKTTVPTQSNANDQPSIIIVEFLGFGGGDGSTPTNSDDDRRSKPRDKQSYNPNSQLQVVGLGELTEQQKQKMADVERTKPGGQQ